jgi:hypothetical protein
MGTLSHEREAYVDHLPARLNTAVALLNVLLRPSTAALVPILIVRVDTSV